MSTRFIQEEDITIVTVISRTPSKECAMVTIKGLPGQYFYKKMILDKSDPAFTRSQRSMYSHLTLNHYTCVDYFQVIETDNFLIYLSNFYPNGNLNEELSKRKKKKNFWSPDQLKTI